MPTPPRPNPMQAKAALAPRPTRHDPHGTVRMRRHRPLAAGTQTRCDLLSTRVIHCGAHEAAAIAASNAEAPSDFDGDFDDASDYTLVDAPVFLEVEWS